MLLERFAAIAREPLPVPGSGATPERHRRLMQIGREDLSLAKLVEAHYDAVSILAEAGREPQPGALYAVWASEIPGQALSLEPSGSGYLLSGTKMFASGAGLVDRALITAGTPEQPRAQSLVEVDLRQHPDAITIDGSAWQTDAFRLTRTSTLTFRSLEVPTDAILGTPGWYVERPGFWHGASGPAACWAGGVAGLLDVASRSTRQDPHTLAHYAAMHANIWALESCLDAAGREIDVDPRDREGAQIRALQVRHLVEQTCTDTLRRFARAYGPYPLSMDAETSRRYREADLYLRQSHGERDLESLGRLLRPRTGN
jgi:alkylation response protein AidB-like acyl-CoA dehydrogenase